MFEQTASINISVELDFFAENKNHAFRECARIAAANDVSCDVMFSALRIREQLGNTGIGEAVALPHGRCVGLKEYHIVVLKLKKSIDYDSLDSKDVRLILAVFAPENEKYEGLSILSQLSVIVRNKTVRTQILNAKSKKQIISLLQLKAIEKAA